jgi:putative SOS response-associated peptidase YedK
MCGRLTQSTPTEQVAKTFTAIDTTEAKRPSWNLPPTASLAIVTQREDRRLESVRWNLAKQQGGKPWFNARSEKIDADTWPGPIYRKLFARHRCLVPYEFFYEWQEQPSGSKQPYAIAPSEGELHAFAGFYDTLDDGTSGAVVLTTAANTLMTWVHNAGARRHRMPVLIHPKSWDTWLDPEADLDQLRPLLAPRPDGELEAMPVVPNVSRRGYDAPDCLEPSGQIVTEPHPLPGEQGGLF